jgi:hypothetical protein
MNDWQGNSKYSEDTSSAAFSTTDPTIDLLQDRTLPPWWEAID